MLARKLRAGPAGYSGHDGLKAFFARGGRLLLSHGWNDGVIPANNTV